MADLHTKYTKKHACKILHKKLHTAYELLNYTQNARCMYLLFCVFPWDNNR